MVLSQADFDRIQNADPSPILANEDPSFLDYVRDAGRGVVHGGLGFAESAVNLAGDVANLGIDAYDYATGSDASEFGEVDFNDSWKPKTFVGDLTSGITQFAIGFGATGAAFKAVGLAGKLAKAGTVVKGLTHPHRHHTGNDTALV